MAYLIGTLLIFAFIWLIVTALQPSTITKTVKTTHADGTTETHTETIATPSAARTAARLVLALIIAGFVISISIGITLYVIGGQG